jgi:hypothetical protein
VELAVDLLEDLDGSLMLPKFRKIGWSVIILASVVDIAEALLLRLPEGVIDLILKSALNWNSRGWSIQD